MDPRAPGTIARLSPDGRVVHDTLEDGRARLPDCRSCGSHLTTCRLKAHPSQGCVQAPPAGHLRCGRTSTLRSVVAIRCVPAARQPNTKSRRGESIGPTCGKVAEVPVGRGEQNGPRPEALVT